jgi:hypothetical protein
VVRGVEIPMESLVRFFDEVEDCDANCQSSGNTQELGGF